MTTEEIKTEQGSLTSYFNQPAARALARLQASPQARSWRFTCLDGSPWSCVGGVPVAFLFVGVNVVSLRRCCSCCFCSCCGCSCCCCCCCCCCCHCYKEPSWHAAETSFIPRSQAKANVSQSFTWASFLRNTLLHPYGKLLLSGPLVKVNLLRHRCKKILQQPGPAEQGYPFQVGVH